MSESVVRIDSLCKSYSGRQVVDGVSLEVRRGECFGLLGPNGAGKTTTLRMLLGHAQPDSGEIEVLGYPIPTQAREMRRYLGVVPQMDNLDPDFTVEENLLSFASYFQLEGDLKAKIDELLEFAALGDKRTAKIEALSGGMKRRLSLARSLVNDPELVILDEPSTGLDPQARHHIWQRLRELISAGTSLILTTHYMDEAQRLCDRIAIIDHGKLLVVGTPEALIREHVEPQVVELFGDGVDEWLEPAQRLSQRCERIGESLFCYCQEERLLIDEVCKAQDIEFVHRPANLEDVFLKLTGRDLRE